MGGHHVRICQNKLGSEQLFFKKQFYVGRAKNHIKRLQEEFEGYTPLAFRGRVVGVMLCRGLLLSKV